MKASFKLFRIAGITIGIHYTWIFAFIFFSWTLAQVYFPVVLLRLEHGGLLDNGHHRGAADFRFGAAA